MVSFWSECSSNKAVVELLGVEHIEVFFCPGLNNDTPGIPGVQSDP